MNRLVSVGDDLTLPPFVVVPAGSLAGAECEYVDSYPRLDGETDDAPRIARAITAAVAANRIVQFGAATYTLASTVTVTDDYVWLRGVGRGSVLTNGTDTVMISCTGHYPRIADMQIEVTDATERANTSVSLGAINNPLIRGVYFRGTEQSRRAGVTLTGGSMGTIEDCVFSHACIKIATWDVKVSRTHVWAMSCDYGIGIMPATGNTTIENTDIVPPLVSNSSGLAGIYVDGTGLACTSIKISDVYLDGNPSLICREGIYVGNGAASVLIQGVNANKMDSDCIVIDSAYSVTVDGYIGIGNNASGLGSREIVVKETGAQAVEMVTLANAACTQTAAVPASPTGAAPAIEVESSVTQPTKVQAHGFTIKQPSSGGGYTVPEVKVPTTAGVPMTDYSLDGIGQLSKYRAKGSVAVTTGDAGKTITLSSPYPLAYRPGPAQIRLAAVGTPLPGYRISYTTDNQIYVAFASTLAGDGTLYWSVDLR